MSFFKSLFGKQDTNNNREEGKDLPLAFTELRKSISGLGDPEHPFNSKEFAYGADSRMPCTDFTGFIIERLQADDRTSIYLLMTEIIRANPGIGVGTEWIIGVIDNILAIPFENYLGFTDDRAYYELRAFWIMAAKDGGDAGSTGSWIASPKGIPFLLSRALSCHQIDWYPKMNQLVDKANAFITRSSDIDRWGPTVWDDYPRFMSNSYQLEPIMVTSSSQAVKQLSIGARIHLMEAVERGGGELPKMASYQKTLGINVTQSSDEILKSNLLSLSTNPQAVQNSLTKKELQYECAQAGTEYRTSWNKSKLMETLVASDPERVEILAKQKQITSINLRYAEDLRTILAYSNDLVTPFKILSFAM